MTAHRKAIPTEAQRDWLNLVYANNGNFLIPVDDREKYPQHYECIGNDWIKKNPRGGYRLTGWGQAALSRSESDDE